MDKIKVLFVDDDVALGNIVTMVLDNSGYEVYFQSSLAGIQSVIGELKPDMIILDVEIGKKNGVDVTPALKQIAPQVPILFVSSHVDSAEVVKALRAGGIAYLKKPFEIEELLAYIDRHALVSSSNEIEIGKLLLDTGENLLKKENKVIKRLSSFECKLIRLFALNINRTLLRTQIEQELWGDGFGNEQSLNNYIAKLRKYLRADASLELITLPRMGYKLIDGRRD